MTKHLSLCRISLLPAIEYKKLRLMVMHLFQRRESVDAVRKLLERSQNAEGAPAVLILEHLTYRQKQYLLRDHIPFVMEGKQIYLPFMAVSLQERGDGERQETTTMLPSAQLLLYYILLTMGAASY